MSQHSLFTRPAEMDDMALCLELDHSGETDRVWQLRVKRQNDLIAPVFQTMRLPHPLRVAYPHSRDQLMERWYKSEAFYVMEKERRPQNGNPLCGYITLTIERVDRIAWIGDLVMDPAFRRQGHGSYLLEMGMQWARTQRATRLMVALQTNNHPAIAFYRKNGFSFWGYNEKWYESGDIGLQFGIKIG